MNKKLASAVEKAQDRYTPQYWADGNFTACILLDDGAICAVGVSKRNPNCDEYIEERGRFIAFVRAVKHLPTRKPKK